MQIGDYEVSIKQVSSSVQVGMAWKVLSSVPAESLGISDMVEQVWTSSILLARYLDADGRATIRERCSSQRHHHSSFVSVLADHARLFRWMRVRMYAGMLSS